MQNIIDLMVTSVIPLFYAFENHEKLLKEFLKQYEGKKRYRNACDNLYDALQEKQQSQQKKVADFQNQKSETEKQIEFTKQKLESHLQLSQLIEPNIINSNELYLQVQQSNNSTIKSLREELDLLDSDIRYFEEQINNSIRENNNEVQVFLEEIRYYCKNPRDGYKALVTYFTKNTEIFTELWLNKDIFQQTCEAWIHFVMTMQLPVHQHPLPSYLCPFNANEKNYTTNVYYQTEKKKSPEITATTQWKRALNPFNAQLQSAQRNKLDSLIKQMCNIQERYFGFEVTQLIKQTNYGDPLCIKEITLFQPKKIPETAKPEDPGFYLEGRPRSHSI